MSSMSGEVRLGSKEHLPACDLKLNQKRSTADIASALAAGLHLPSKKALAGNAVSMKAKP